MKPGNPAEVTSPSNFSHAAPNALNPPPTSVSTGLNFSLKTSIRRTTVGRSAEPTLVFISSMRAEATCILCAKVSDSREKFPCASVDCSNRSAWVISCFSWVENEPPTFLIPISRPLAVNAASFRLIPYRSIGSISPRKAAEIASIASAVVPP